MTVGNAKSLLTAIPLMTDVTGTNSILLDCGHQQKITGVVKAMAKEKFVRCGNAGCSKKYTAKIEVTFETYSRGRYI
jgi:transcription elongation factor Elf1